MEISDYSNIINKKIADEIFAIEPINLYEPIVYSLSSGGKRLRPLLCLLACELFGENHKDSLDAAVGLEFFHNFTLFHDDVMDKALTRRGMPTVAKKWNDNVAILSGDALFIIAYQYLCKTNKKSLENVLNCFNKMAIEVCEGQQYDMDFEKEKTIDVDDYLKMIRLKTAVLLASSLKIGAIIADANSENQQYIYDFGINLGLAFQLQDDFLDVYGNENFGKKIGGDIVENKKTFLLIKALELADEDDKSIILHYFSNNNFDNNEKIESIIKIYNKLNISNLVNIEMNKFHNKAIENLEKISNFVPEIKNILFQLSETCLNRKK